MKAFHELHEAFPSLLDENGNRKPFERFLNDVQSIDATYNANYLRAEYNLHTREIWRTPGRLRYPAQMPVHDLYRLWRQDRWSSAGLCRLNVAKKVETDPHGRTRASYFLYSVNDI